MFKIPDVRLYPTNISFGSIPFTAATVRLTLLHLNRVHSLHCDWSKPRRTRSCVAATNHNNSKYCWSLSSNEMRSDEMSWDEMRWDEMRWAECLLVRVRMFFLISCWLLGSLKLKTYASEDCLLLIFEMYCAYAVCSDGNKITSFIIHSFIHSFITSTEEGGYVFSSVCLSVCLSVRRITRKDANLWTDFDEIFWRGRAWLKNQMIQFWWRSGSRFGSGSPKSEIRILRIGGGLCSLSAFLVRLYELSLTEQEST